MLKSESIVLSVNFHEWGGSAVSETTRQQDM